MNDNFNKNLRNAFDEAEDDFNPEIIWQGITDKMKPEKEDKRRYFLFWIVGIGAGILVLAFYLNAVHRDSEITKKEEETTKGIRISDLDIARTSLSANIEFESNSETKVFSEFNSDSDENLVVIKSIAGSDSTHVINRQKALSIFEISKPMTPEQNPIIDSYEFLTSKSINQNSASTIEISEINNRSKNSFTKSRNQYSIEELLLRKTNKIPTNFILSPFLDIQKPVIKKRIVRNVEVFTAVYFGEKLNTSTNTEYITHRNSKEQLLEQVSLGTRVQFLDFIGFTFWLGVKFSEITDAWEAQYQYNQDLPYTYLEYTVEKNNGDIEDHFATAIVAYDVKRRVVQYNKEQIFNFPIEIRYQSQFNRWTLSPSIGFEFNYLLGADHTVMGLDILPIKEVKSGRWLSPSFFAGLNLSYSVNPALKLNTGISYRVLDINNSTLVPDLNSRYTLYGFELGIGRRF